jgi:hypothetical protein
MIDTVVIGMIGFSVGWTLAHVRWVLRGSDPTPTPKPIQEEPSNGPYRTSADVAVVPVAGPLKELVDYVGLDERTGRIQTECSVCGRGWLLGHGARVCSNPACTSEGVRHFHASCLGTWAGKEGAGCGHEWLMRTLPPKVPVPAPVPEEGKS